MMRSTRRVTSASLVTRRHGSSAVATERGATRLARPGQDRCTVPVLLRSHGLLASLVVLVRLKFFVHRLPRGGALLGGGLRRVQDGENLPGRLEVPRPPVMQHVG